jgi:hypothetical protein
MSADNWAHCPRCTARELALLDRRREAIAAAYGKIPVEQFDAEREELAVAEHAFKQRDRTFREDYSITGAEDGEVEVRYSGRCTYCNLKLSFVDTHPMEIM